MDIALMNAHLSANRSIVLSEMDKRIIIEKVTQALKELTTLTVNNLFWAASPIDEGYVLDWQKYSTIFPKSSYMTSTCSLFESSIGSAVVPLKASDLAGMFLDMNQWADLFPTIVKEAKILKSLDIGSLIGSLHLIYGRMHILSPLVAPREFIFLRYCVQQPSNTWFIVDVSHDFLGEIQVAHPTFSWRLPSGVVIQSLSDAQSKVTWVEHVNVNGSLVHPLYGRLLSTSHGYGAARWLHTLLRMTERSLYSVISRSTGVYALEDILEGRKNMKTFSLRMIRDFCSILSMPGNLSKSSNPNIRISVRNINEPGQPHFTIVAASTSMWLPLTFEDLFKFLRDENRRPEWDVMNDRTPISDIKCFSTGTTPGNYISVIQTSFMKERNTCLLQESSIDPIGALVIFTLIDLPKIMEIANGAYSSNIPILPCGFLISSDGSPNGNGSDGASTSRGTTSKPSGSLLTLAFQWLLLDISESGLNEAADTLNNILTSTIHYIRVALDCP